jgi:prepilin-type N-terminal cleavage/methylation domain-containing protein
MLRKRSSGSRGFTMIEMLVASMVLAIAVLIGLPELRKMYVRMQLESYVLNLSSVANKARYEAIKRGMDTVVKADYTGRTLFTFVDQPTFDANGVRTDTPWVFDPAVDEIIQGLPLPDSISFTPPPGENTVEGLTDPVGADQDEDHVAVFLTDGSVQDVGSFRLGDTRSNYVQLSFNPQATGRVRTEKWDCIDSVWRDRAENWVWEDRRLTGC